MGYIKFVLGVRKTDDSGNTVRTVISRFESDMANAATLETNIIMHALSCRGKVETESKGFPYAFPLIFKSK
jgi:hypothetical protein|nr:MAG TPA: hypothetical protein [Caudoviricetes sp.]